MKKLFKRIAPLLLALVMVMGSCLTVSAATSLPSTDKEYEAIIEKYQKIGYPYSVCYSQPSNSVAVFGIYYFSAEPRINSQRLFNFSTSGSYYYVTYDEVHDIWTSHEVSDFNINTNIGLFCYDSVTVKYSNFDIYEVGADKEKDDPFFRGPVPPLVGAVQGAAPEEALKEVILLIPLSILFLAGCLGLRKGLRLLLTLLRQA